MHSFFLFFFLQVANTYTLQFTNKENTYYDVHKWGNTLRSVPYNETNHQFLAGRTGGRWEAWLTYFPEEHSQAHLISILQSPNFPCCCLTAVEFPGKISASLEPLLPATFFLLILPQNNLS